MLKQNNNIKSLTMKKVLYTIAVGALTLGAVACSSDNGANTKDEKVVVESPILKDLNIDVIQVGINENARDIEGEKLKHICDAENIKYEEDAIRMIAESSNGGLRDAISLLDQVNSYTNGNIKSEDVLLLNGHVSIDEISQLFDYTIVCICQCGYSVARVRCDYCV